MHVARLGTTPVKGARHRARTSVRLQVDGAVDDRTFCLVDALRDHCLRTVANPLLLRAQADWSDGTLTVDLPSGRYAGRPRDTGRQRIVEYWGRQVQVTELDGPWAAAFSELLGQDVVLCRSRPGDVVYGAPVTLVTSSSLARLAEVVGHAVEGARFRATIELDTGALPPHVEDGWAGRRLRVGGADLRVTGVVPRCAVVDLDPATATPDLRLLAALATYRLGPEGVGFGVYAEVIRPGPIRPGDRAALVD